MAENLQNEENSNLGPAKISFPTFVLKLLAGTAGGIAGSLILLLIFVLASSILAPLTEPDPEYISPIFIFILMVMIFLASTIGNILSTFLLSLTERDKYTRRASTIYQVFMVSVIMFVLMVPVYFLAASVNISVAAYAVALHIFLAAQVSAIILEIISNYRYSLVGVYGVTFSILMSAAILFGVSNVISNPTLLLFISLPVVWGSIAFMQSVVTMIYGWIVRIYDKDFLSTQTLYGKDYGVEVESEKIEAPKAKDEAGSDFLKHNQ